MQNTVLKSCLQSSHHVNDKNEYGRFCVYSEFTCISIITGKMCQKTAADFNRYLAVDNSERSYSFQRKHVKGKLIVKVKMSDTFSHMNVNMILFGYL